MKLKISERAPGKGDAKRIRREGNIPAVLYGDNKAGQTVTLNGEEMQTILRNMKPGLLSTTVFLLEDGKKQHRAVIKDIQYHFTSYAIEHIDFALLTEQKPISLNVPIVLAGVADCVGVKLGGFVRQICRTLKVNCLPKDIPQEFVLDVRNLNVGQSLKLSQIAMPANVRPMAKLDQIAVAVGKKAGT
jgi:large subunit ribosomal protein L25